MGRFYDALWIRISYSLLVFTSNNIILNHGSTSMIMIPSIVQESCIHGCIIMVFSASTSRLARLISIPSENYGGTLLDGWKVSGWRAWNSCRMLLQRNGLLHQLIFLQNMCIACLHTVKLLLMSMESIRVIKMSLMFRIPSENTIFADECHIHVSHHCITLE